MPCSRSADMYGVLVMYTHKQVQLVDSAGGGGWGEAFLSVHPQLISSFRQPQENSDPPITKVSTCINICVCVCVSRSCLAAHTVLTCMENWSRGFGEAFLSVHPQLISSLRQPQESTDAPRMKVYIYIYEYVCVCVSRSCLAHTVLTCMEYWSCIPTNKSNW